MPTSRYPVLVLPPKHEAAVAELNKKIALAQKVCPMAALLAQLRNRLEELKQRIQTEEGRLPSSARGSSRSHQVVSKELKEAQAKWCVPI